MKRFIAATLTGVMAASAIGMAAIADEPVKILINGAELTIPADDTQPFIEEERTLVPMRAIFEALGATVNWDEETRTIVSYDPVSDVSITMQIDSAQMFVGETPVELDVPAKIVGDRTVVPIRAIAEGMHSVVDWDGNTRTVIVTKEMKPAVTPAPVTTPAPSAAPASSATPAPSAAPASSATPAPSADPSAQIPNPWITYATVEELDKAIEEAGDVAYLVPDGIVPFTVNADGYRYLPTENMAELVGTWAVGKGYDATIRYASGASDISGISGGTLVEKYKLDSGETITISQMDDIVYATWTDKLNNETFSHCVTVKAGDDEATALDIVKSIVKDVASSFHK